MELESKARRHWKEFLPNKVAALKAENRLEEALRFAAVQAQQEILDLMAGGYKEREARESALATFILLPPEPEADEELEAMERQHQADRLGERVVEILYDLKEAFREKHERYETASELDAMATQARELAKQERIEQLRQLQADRAARW